MNFLKTLQQESAPVFSAISAVLLGTVMHQTILGGFPFGIALAGLLVLGLGLRLRKPRRRAWLFAILTALGIFYVGLDSNQDAMIPANTLGFIWGYGSIGLASLVAMWPNFKH